jgi:hypothetical protein
VSFPARQARVHYRHELRTLTYVTLDEANGGIIRNLNREGVAVQAVGALRQQQRVRLRFDLRFPRLRVEAHGQVTWASSSGQCGIRFADLPERTRHQINQWIFSNLLDAVLRDAAHPRSTFGAAVVSVAGKEDAREQNDQEAEESSGLTLSAPSRPAICLQSRFARHDRLQPWPEDPVEAVLDPVDDSSPLDRSRYDLGAQRNWLSRPISGPTIAWLVDGLVVIAGLLLFALVFLSIAHELPPWRLTLGTASAAAVFVAAAYWTLFGVLGEASLGARLAQAAYGVEQGNARESAGRFR